MIITSVIAEPLSDLGLNTPDNRVPVIPGGVILLWLVLISASLFFR